MIDTTPVDQTSSHDDMLYKTGEALRVLLADQQTQQSSVDALHEIARRQEEDLATHQQRRGELLEGLRTAQLASNKAQAARDLAAGGKTAKKREAAYEQAVSAVSAIQHELLALAGADDQLRGEQASTLATLAAAQDTMGRIQERVTIAQSIYDEELTAHREEIKATYLEKLQEARQQRDYLKQQLLLAEDAVTQAQAALASALKDWPDYATQVLDEHLEIAPYPSSMLLEAYLRLSELIEQHSQGLVRADPATLKALSVPIPTHVFAVSGPREAQREAYRRNYKSPGRAIDPQLWGYDTHLGEVEELRAQRQAEHRQAVIHELIWQGRE